MINGFLNWKFVSFVKWIKSNGLGLNSTNEESHYQATTMSYDTWISFFPHIDSEIPRANKKPRLGSEQKKSIKFRNRQKNF